MTDDSTSLAEWCSKNFIRFHPDIKIKKNKTGTLGVFAKEDLDPQNEVYFDPEISPEEYPEYEGSLKPLIRIPKISIFSARNSFISNILIDLNIRGIAALIMAFIYEYELKEKSPWYAYFKSFGNFLSLDISKFEINQQEDGFVSPEDTESLFLYLCEEADIIEKHVSIPIPQILKVKQYTSKAIESFAKISKLIAFKCFDIDDFHEVALVPVADLFRDTIEKHQCRFECIDTVCSVCGSIDCEHLENGISMNEIMSTEEQPEDDVSIKSNDLKKDLEEAESSDSDLNMFESDMEDEEPITEITEEYIQRMEKKMKEFEEEDVDDVEDGEDQEENDEFDFEIPEYLRGHRDDFGGDIDGTNCCDVVLIAPVKKNEQLFY